MEKTSYYHVKFILWIIIVRFLVYFQFPLSHGQGQDSNPRPQDYESSQGTLIEGEGSVQSTSSLR
jgi:hypothetical protein